MDKNNAKLIQRIVKTKTEDALHSSAYAKIQNTQGFGSPSLDSFTSRRAMENRRQFVQGYKNSKIISSATVAAPRPKTFTPPATKTAIPSRTSGPKPGGLR